MRVSGSKSVALKPARHYTSQIKNNGGNVMAWTTPTLTEICIGLEINGYLPAEF
jgi:coenzyme PQQ precursor peptide PqqA